MSGHVAEFKSVLELAPLILLGADDARVVADATTAAEILQSLDNEPPVSVVLVGCTGVGKSYLLNRLAGRDISEASVIRPTTTSVVTADVFGGVVADTPAWGLDIPATEAALVDADVGVLVVTPSRYADATTEAAWKAVEVCPQKLVVLNRQRGPSGERDAVLASVEERFDVEVVVVVEESGDTDHLLEELHARMSDRTLTDARRTIALSTARNAARHIARAVTASAGDLSRLSDVVESVSRPRIGRRPLAVRESWFETQQEILDEIGRLVDDLDLEIVNSFEGNLSSRILSQMDPWQKPDVEPALAAWRGDTAARFKATAKVRWRTTATMQMIDDASWKVGVNPSVVVSRRVSRVMGPSLGILIDEVHSQLLGVGDDIVDSRVNDWRRSIEEAGSFKPGELLAAADALGLQ